MLKPSELVGNLMRILEQSHNRLVLRHRPIGSWVTGGSLAALGFGTIVFSAQLPIATILHRDHIQPDFVLCHLTSSTWIGLQRQRTITDVRSVEIAERRVKGGTQPYLFLATPTESVEISNSQNQVVSVDDTQAFLSYPQIPTLTLHYQQSTPVSILVLLPFIHLGIAVYLLMMPLVTCTFYRSIHIVVIERHRCGRTYTLEYSLHSIYQVQVEEVRQKNGKEYQIVLWLKETGRLRLTRDCSNRLKQMLLIAQSIREFLHLAS